MLDRRRLLQAEALGVLPLVAHLHDANAFPATPTDALLMAPIKYTGGGAACFPTACIAS
jgi:hypothetical protein